MSSSAISTPTRSNQTRSGVSGTREVRAQILSFGGGVILAIGILFIASAWGMAGRPASSTVAALFGFLALATFAYLLDGISERLSLRGNELIHTRLFGGKKRVTLENIESLLFVHEGLNQQVGIESITANYKNGETERLALGPCWRRRELELFLSSVEHVVGKGKLLEEVR